MYPNLAGQYPEYIKLQLELFKVGHRGGTSYSHLMRHVAGHLSSGEMDDLATFFSGLTEITDSQ
jgi:cytochrome c553